MSDRRLQALPVPTGPGVLAALPALRAALNGVGPALLPHPAGQAGQGGHAEQAGRWLAALRPGEPLLTGDGEDDPHDPTVLVVATSGSTGVPKGTLLPASALLASASATHDRLGGPGHWLLALPAAHVAGLQVLIRSLVGGTVPQVLDLADGFTAEGFAEAAANTPGRTSGGRRYTSLVPTQLVRLLDAGGPALTALAGFDAVLVGGAATPAALLDRARTAGVRVVTSYGMSETCGGCVYDGIPLDGVRAVVDPSGRISLGGPVVARGYRRPAASIDDGPAPDLAAGVFWTAQDGVRWFRTDDAGRWEPDGPPTRPTRPTRLIVAGRIDDAVLTGGLTVMPSAVEAALHAMPGVAHAVVVGVPDEQWGQRVVAAIVAMGPGPAPTLAQVRAHVAQSLEPAAAPRQLLVLERLPLRGPGKPDRAEIARRAVDH